MNSLWWGIRVTAVCSFVFALAGIAEPMSLQEVREEARRANLTIKTFQEKSIQAEELSNESFTKMLPVLSLLGQSYYASQEGGTTISPGTYGQYPFGPIPNVEARIITEENNLSFNWGVRVQQPIFTGGRLYYSYQSSKSLWEEARSNEDQTVQDIFMNTEKAYLNLLKAIDNLKVAQLHKRALDDHLADMEKRYKYGRVALNDVLKVRVEVAQADGDLLRANNQVTLAEGQVNLILNRPLERKINPQDVGPLRKVNMSEELAREIAKSDNKALGSARARKQTAEFQRKVAEADYYPSINLTAQYLGQSGQPQLRDNWWTVAVGLEWPIWQWGGTKAKVNATKAYERQTEYDVLSLENEIVSRVREAFIQISEADQRVKIDEEAVKQAEENNRITNIGYTHGRKTSTEVLDAEDLLTKARSSYVQDTYNAHFARTMLRYQLGKVEADDLLTTYVPVTKTVQQPGQEKP